MRRVASSWKLIEAVLKEHAHSAYKALRPPASQKEINRLQDVLDTKLPTDFLSSLQIHDGMHAAGDFNFIDYRRLLPIAEIASDRKSLWDLQRECEFGGDQFTRTRKIRNDSHWRAGWVPIMDFNGDKVVLDLDPGPAGKRGQIISWDNYGNQPMRVLGESFGTWLDMVAEELAQRRFTLDEYGGIHLRKPLGH
jgi:molybdopterin molybdotransferase